MMKTLPRGGLLILLLVAALRGEAATEVTPIDTTPPTAPGQPIEGDTQIDADYDGNGSYTIRWPAATDPDSLIRAYHLQERTNTSWGWKTLSGTIKGTSFAVTGRRHNIRYLYRVRAQNSSFLWGPWSVTSDGIKVDTTPPASVAAVTDDGELTQSATTLHFTWSASQDAESGIQGYEYEIRKDATTGPVERSWTDVGNVTETEATGLTLTSGERYFVGLRARNNALRVSTPTYSDGILVQIDREPPEGTMVINEGAAATPIPAVILTLSATDDSGTVSQMQFSDDNITYTPAEPYATSKEWTLPSGDGPKTVYVKFNDPHDNWSVAVSDTIILDTTPPTLLMISPADGDVLGAP